jgi:hypothetical protein
MPRILFASRHPEQDKVAEAVCFFLGNCHYLYLHRGHDVGYSKLLFGLSTKVVYTATHCNNYPGIVFGTGVTLIAILFNHHIGFDSVCRCGP